MEQLTKEAGRLYADILAAYRKLKLEGAKKELQTLGQQMAEPDFWHDKTAAQTASKRAAFLKNQIEPWQKLLSSSYDIVELAEIGDSAMQEELEFQLDGLKKQFEELRKTLRFNQPYDDHEVILSIFAGAGGTDAQDWAQMLLRMYGRWCEAGKIEVKTIDQSAGEEAGIKSVTLRLSGAPYLYGKLRGEHGVHRLVRLSPFNADNLRQTSFAKVEVLPAIDSPGEIEIDDKDLKIDVYRAGGHGGQSVNTTDSAVRVTHIPTGISAAIQNERSQLQNKETALGLLRSKLAGLQLEQHAVKISQLKGSNEQASWGNQIRSYVLHPYKQVKDLRTKYETSEPEKVLDGNLDQLLEAYHNYSMSS